MTPQRVRHLVKLAIAHVLYGLGLLQLWQRLYLRRRAVVLMYHRVLNESERAATGSHPGMVVTRTTFEAHMRLLRQRFTPLTLREFAGRLRARQTFADSSCLITFDDGWRDNLVHAMPALRAHQVPAAIFLPVNFVGTRRLFAREGFTHLVMRARETAMDSSRAARIRALLAGASLAYLLDIASDDPRATVIEAIGAAPVDASIETLVGALAIELGVQIDELGTPDAFMAWSEVESLAREGVAFGGHGAEHRRLALLPSDERDAEIHHSKAVLASRLSPDVWAFAYPNGSCNDEVAAAVGAAGYELAFTTEPGVVTCGDNPLLLRRVNMHEDMTGSAPMFLARLVGLF